MAIGVATGTSITFGTSSFTGNWLSISVDGIERASIDTSHLQTTTARTFIGASLYDPGSITVQVQWDPGAAVKPPINGPAETITLTKGANTMVFSGFVTGYGVEFPLEELMVSEITIKASGPINYT